MKITGTFLDEISHDINHQNWGAKEWEADFQAMQSIGIDTVILIRSGYRRWITYPSDVLMRQEGCFAPPIDLVALFLELSQRYGMRFYFGLYDSGKYWVNARYREETALNMLVIQEVVDRYGAHPAFGGWYFSHEINRNVMGVVEEYAVMGHFCKNLLPAPILISPYIDGKKALLASEAAVAKEAGISLETHRQEWDEVLRNVQGIVDTIAFQDGHVDFEDLEDFMRINKQLSDRYGLQGWTNCESFDRDMPIKFLPIKWEKMKFKLEAAQRVGMDKAITFEFSHFMSPHSSYRQAQHLFNRYREYIGLLPA
ncbi:MAG TPA: DUF4434 domain-containing protein [Saprospiraceae bacterium]|nr:DUF4434 domain-containing protein [Saprospiraceae bacterium]HMQ82930.1 DUF4434 domain-containing protein [Saprospiraceae bacterium]